MRRAGALAVPAGEDLVRRADHLRVAREVRFLGCPVAIGPCRPHLQAEAKTHGRVTNRSRRAMCSTGQDHGAGRQRLELRLNELAISDGAAAASEDPQMAWRLRMDEVDASGLSREGEATVFASGPLSVPDWCQQVGVRVWPPRSFDYLKGRPAVSIAHAPSPPPCRRVHHSGFAMESCAKRGPTGSPGMSPKANRCGGPAICNQTAPSNPMEETVSTAVVQKRQRLTFGGRTGLIRSWSSPSRTRVGGRDHTRWMSRALRPR